MGFFQSLLDALRRLFSPAVRPAPPPAMRPPTGAPSSGTPRSPTPTPSFESFLPKPTTAPRLEARAEAGSTARSPAPTPPPASPPPASRTFSPAPPTSEQLDQAFRTAAREVGVPELLLRAIADIETGGGRDLGWKRGHPSYGIMQINCGSRWPDPDAKCTRPFPTLPEWPSTPRRLLTDHVYNVRLGALILREQLRRYPTSIPRALAAYNAGPSAIPRDAVIPKLVEYRGGGSATPRDYALKVLARYAARGGPDLRAAPELRG